MNIGDVNDQDTVNQIQNNSEEKQIKNDIKQPNFFMQKVKEFNDENLEKIVDFLNNPADKLKNYVTEYKCQNDNVSEFLNNYKKEINSFINKDFKIMRSENEHGIRFLIFGSGTKYGFISYGIHISSNKKISIAKGFYGEGNLVFELPENVKLNVDINEQAAPAVDNFK